MNKRILLIDDDEQIVDVLSVVLRFEGYIVDAFHCVREALFIASTQKYDLIVSDIMMPEFTGYDLISAVREPRHVNMETPALAITALDGTTKHRLISAGFQGYLGKPFDMCDLKSNVLKLISAG